jgi:quercetin dioxygenase-like cupin family protein
MQTPIVRRKSECQVQEFAWGQLTWFASGALGNSTHQTVGRCIIKPGMANPRHTHPNCAEVLVVLQGTIAHELGDGTECTMQIGDVISVPEQVPHRARNIGADDAVLYISFSSAERQTQGE